MTLHSEVSGSGPDLVLLHGWGMHAGIWDELVPELSPRLRVHAVDLPGYGASPACDPYTLEQMAVDLARQMPRRCMVCGWSLGGQAALAWARTAPRQVVRLALIATTPCFTRRVDWPHGVEASVLNDFVKGLTTDYAATLKRFLALQALGDEQARQVVARMRARLFDRGRPDAQVLNAGLKILLGADLRGELAAIAQPALVLHGDRDRLTPLAAGEYLSRSLPNARFSVVCGAAHAPFVSNLREVSTLLVDFFDKR